MHGTATRNIHCQYLAKLNPDFVSSDIASFVERWDDDLKVAGSRPLCATIFRPTKFAVGIRLYS